MVNVKMGMWLIKQVKIVLNVKGHNAAIMIHLIHVINVRQDMDYKKILYVNKIAKLINARIADLTLKELSIAM